MKVTVRIGKIRVKASQPVDASRLRQQVSAAVERKLATQTGGWSPAKMGRVNVDAGRSGPERWGDLVAGAIERAGRQL
jgi:hypothetical protein